MTIRIAAAFGMFAALVASTGWTLESPPTDVYGSPGRCAICGKPGPCQQKICQVQCGIEKATKYRWEVEVHDICTMLPRRPCGCGDQQCGACEVITGCEEQAHGSRCDPCQPKGVLSRWIEQLTEKPVPIIAPRPGQPRAVKKLVKKEYVIEKPVYRTVVQYVCAECLGIRPSGTCDIPACDVPSLSPPESVSIPKVSPSSQLVPVSAVRMMPPAPLPPLE